MVNKNAPVMNTRAMAVFCIATVMPCVFLYSFCLFSFFNVSKRNAELLPELRLTPTPLIIFAIKNIQNPLKKAIKNISKM